MSFEERPSIPNVRKTRELKGNTNLANQAIKNKGHNWITDEPDRIESSYRRSHSNDFRNNMGNCKIKK